MEATGQVGAIYIAHFYSYQLVRGAYVAAVTLASETYPLCKFIML